MNRKRESTVAALMGLALLAVLFALFLALLVGEL